MHTVRTGSNRTRSARERGAVAVEMAIVIPLLFLVIAAIVDLGRAFFFQIQLTNAAREGARAAVVMASGPTVVTRATNAAAGVQGVTVSVQASCTAGVASDASVKVTAPFQWIILGPAMSMVGQGFAGGSSISSTGVMRCSG